MKVWIEVIGDLEEEEITIRCRELDARMQRIQKYLMEEAASLPRITYYKGEEEFFIPLSDVLFFETDGEGVFAHTAKDAYRIKQRLYGLETILPRYFVRAAKGTILNTRHVYSIQRNLASASLVQFKGSHKQVYVSRFYFQEFKKRMEERK